MLKAGNLKIKRIGFYALIVFYLLAGINHFIMPAFYFPLIPPSFQFISEINLISGGTEIVLALGLCWSSSRKIAAAGIVLLLLAFLPSHLHFIDVGGCLSESLCVPLWVAWVRLIVIHPLLIIWAYRYRNFTWE